MIDLLVIVAAGLAAATAIFTLALALRRLQVGRHERRRRALEAGLRPIALEIIEGERAPDVHLSPAEIEVLAAVLGRYAKDLTGQARQNISAFFVRHGTVRDNIRALGDRRPWRRATAAYLLGNVGPAAVVPPLLGAIDDPHRDVRTAAVRALGKLRAAEAVEPMVEALAGRGIPRAAVGQALLSVGPPALGPLEGLFAHPSPNVRATAVELAGLLADAADAELILERLRDSSAEVRAAAARTLGRIGDERAAGALRALLDDRIPFVRSAAAEALGRIGDDDAVPALVSQASGDEFEPARAAGRALLALVPDSLAGLAAAPDAGAHLQEAADLAAIGRA